MMPLNPAHDTMLLAAADHPCCELGGEAVVLNLATGTYFGLDAVGTRVWGLLHHPRTLSALRDILTAEFDVSPEQCEADLHVFLSSLGEHGLLRYVDASAA